MGTFTMGTLTTDYIVKVNMSDKCIVAKRPVTLREEGEEIDTGTFVDNPTQFTVTLRLSDEDKIALENEMNDEVFKTITLVNTEGEAGTWTFSNAWLEDKNITFENSVGIDNINRRWLTTLRIIAESASWVAS